MRFSAAIGGKSLQRSSSLGCPDVEQIGKGRMETENCQTSKMESSLFVTKYKLRGRKTVINSRGKNGRAGDTGADTDFSV